MENNKMLMPETWRPEHKLFPYQVGFTCPPFDFDAAPSDFLRLAPETVGAHGWMLHVPDYKHGLDQRKQNFGMMDDFVHCMSRNGADVCGQVGSNWVHASGLGVDGIRDHCAQLSDKYDTPFHMAGYAMVEALREMNVEKVALNAAYHWPDWWQGTVGFLKEAGFDVLWAGNFHDQGWFPTQEAVNDHRWVFDGNLALKSFEYVAEQAPNADKATTGLTLETVWDDIQKRATKGPVFLKDFPHYINHMWTPEFLSNFNHAFLIRNPAKTISSMYNKWPDFDEGEVGFPEQRALFDLLTALNGTPPPVIDSDDLLEDPETMVKLWCEAVGIPFIPKALKWDMGGNPSEHSWWDGGSFHGNLASSTGLKRQERKYIEVADAPNRVKQVYRRMRPHYDHLYQYRLKA